MIQPKWKKMLILSVPYILLGLLATKIGQAYRLSSGAVFSQKALHYMEGLTLAFASPYPSFHPLDLSIGILAGAGIRLSVYFKSKNAKKYRHGTEHGSARWSA